VTKVFISYRRGETNPYAGRLYDGLAARFGNRDVFMDVDTIEPGADFTEHIRGAVSGCDALVVLIGPDWLEAVTPDGRRRLDDPDDWVRLEVATGLERGIRVVPVLVEGAQMPPAEELPADLAPLTRRHALSVSHLHWRDDFGRLAAALERGESSRDDGGWWRSRKAAFLGAGAVTLALVIAAIVLLGGGEDARAPTAATAPRDVERIAVGRAPTGTAVGHGSLWVTNADDGTVARIDPATRRVAGTPVQVGGNPTYLAVDERSVWVTTPGAQRGELHRIDPAVNAVAGDPVPAGRQSAGVVAGAGAVWVANAGGGTVSRHDPVDGRRVAVIRVGGVPRVPVVAYGRVWVTDSDGVVHVIDPRSNRVEAAVDVGRGPIGLAAGGRELWVANSSDDTVSRIDPSLRRVVGEVRAGRTPAEVAVGGNAVWIANESDGTVTRIDLRSRARRTIRVGRAPAGLSVGAGAVWVPNTDDDEVARIALPR
jgi:YVTN family beta-propeller protein